MKTLIIIFFLSWLFETIKAVEGHNTVFLLSQNNLNENVPLESEKKDRAVKRVRRRKSTFKKRTIETITTSNICLNDRLSIFKNNLKKEKNPILFGKISDRALYVNLKKINFPHIEIELAANNKTIDMARNRFISPATFKLEGLEDFKEKILSWSLGIYDKKMNLVELIKAKGPLPEEIVWRKIKNKKKVVPDNSYFYSLTVETGSNKQFSSSPKPFLIRSVSEIRSQIPIQNLKNYETIFSKPKTEKFLERLSVQIKSNPEDNIHVVGYYTNSNPRLCDNMFRLRNFLVGKAGIPVDRFYVSCSKTASGDPESKRIIITGTKPTKTIDIVEFTPASKDILLIDDKRIDLNPDNLFVFPEKNVDHIYEVKVNFASGEKFLIKNSFKNFLLFLDTGDNILPNGHIRLGYNFSPYVSCGLVEIEPASWTASLGLGPYNVSNSFAPGLSQATLFKASIKRKNIKILGSRNYVFSLGGFGIPGSFTATKLKNQTLYSGYMQLGYEIKTTNVNVTPFLGYYYTTSNNVESKNHSFIKLLYGGLTGITFSFNKLFWKKVEVEDSIKIKPYLFKGNSNMGFENHFVLTHHLTETYGLSFTWLKNTFKYFDSANGKNVTENMDGYIFSFVYRF